MTYPSLTWVRSQLRNNSVSRIRHKVISAYVVGSYARGTAVKDSDLDIAVVIPRMEMVSALQATERYHSKFRDARFLPVWNGVQVDFQFFYPDDVELAGYSKIKIA